MRRRVKSRRAGLKRTINNRHFKSSNSSVSIEDQTKTDTINYDKKLMRSFIRRNKELIDSIKLLNKDDIAKLNKLLEYL